MASKLGRADNLEEYYSERWPPRVYFADRHHVTREQLEELRGLIEDDSPERPIDTFLKQPANRPVLAMCLAPLFIGHHGAWIISQQTVRPAQREVQQGLIPDYIIGGLNSGGFEWYVVDLKGADAKLFTTGNGRTYFSDTANKGVFQMLEYIDYCTEAQAYIRDTLKLTDFREPKGLMLIGRASELEQNPLRQKLRAHWNRLSGGRLEVRTYDSLLRAVEEQVLHQESQREGR